MTVETPLVERLRAAAARIRALASPSASAVDDPLNGMMVDLSTLPPKMRDTVRVLSPMTAGSVADVLVEKAMEIEECTHGPVDGTQASRYVWPALKVADRVLAVTEPTR